MRSYSESYRQAGVDIEAGYEGVKRMRKHVERTFTPGVLSGIGDDRPAQKASLAWLREQSRDPRCLAVLANHDPDVRPGTLVL